MHHHYAIPALSWQQYTARAMGLGSQLFTDWGNSTLQIALFRYAHQAIPKRGVGPDASVPTHLGGPRCILPLIQLWSVCLDLNQRSLVSKTSMLTRLHHTL